VIDLTACQQGTRVAIRNEASEVEAGAPAVEIGTVVEHRPGMSLVGGGPRVKVRWDSGEQTWVEVSVLELATDELEDEYGGSAAVAGAS
jgi:hypothetical protein